VVLPITFETRNNYRTEYIKFKVTNFETSCNANLGRPTLAKFMAIPHYVFLVLKMSGPNGILALQGGLKRSYDCDTEAMGFAATSQVPNTMMEIFVVSKKLAPREHEIPEKMDIANKLI
jgi:hypothetical protein